MNDENTNIACVYILLFFACDKKKRQKINSASFLEILGFNLYILQS